MIIRANEDKLSQSDRRQINELLSVCFGSLHEGREYFKQIPNGRLLVRYNGIIIAQMGFDYRMMALNQKAVRVWGVIDLCVHPNWRGNGIACKLLKRLEKIACESQADFIILFADDARLYETQGFKKAQETRVRWIKLHAHSTLGVGDECINELMIKQIGETSWEPGVIDMMGYLY